MNEATTAAFGALMAIAIFFVMVGVVDIVDDALDRRRARKRAASWWRRR